MHSHLVQAEKSLKYDANVTIKIQDLVIIGDGNYPQNGLNVLLNLFI